MNFTFQQKVAIMFIDIRNFTCFASKKSPEEIALYINAFFRIVINTVSRYNGFVNQFLGDGCLVTFGTPLDPCNLSQNAVDASMMILRNLDKAVQNGEIEQTKIGIGIHIGEVVTGNLGTKERYQHSVTGSAVILASRIEQLNKQFGSQLLVSEDVMRSVGQLDADPVSFRNVPLKGWHQPVSIYKLA
ncbi:adenylate/guanylate cyclase domain-containing protein [Flavihumibacter solisilvae]|uniref:adenylate/guanylate cyclase domain-containing protein n=1 Tax=Flavihumibacter solisilvae TaxID=1349421 RepID=UPI0013648973|nr:adenylate/guanylate cyclase domain-containing protein [Flavihumibacter solisilvae]